MDAPARAPTYEYTTLNEIAAFLEERELSQSAGAYRTRQYYPNIYLVALECSTVHQSRRGTGMSGWEGAEMRCPGAFDGACSTPCIIPPARAGTDAPAHPTTSIP